jgi:dihydrolipoamide dehydrogenase
MLVWRKGNIESLVRGIEVLFKNYNIDYFKGEVTYVGRNFVIADIDGDSKRFESRNIVLATGSRPISIRGLEYDGKRIISNRELVNLDHIPHDVLIIGGGAVGLEAATYLHYLGSQVSLIEMLEHILPSADREISRRLQAILKRKGVKVFTGTVVSSAEKTDHSIDVTLESKGRSWKVETDMIIVAAGRSPNTGINGLRQVGIEMDRHGYIRVKDNQETNVKGIYAIGDITGPPLIAHKASWEGLNVAEYIGRKRVLRRPKYFPLVVFSKPEVLMIGMTEEEARERYGDVMVGKFPMSALGISKAISEDLGFIKVIVKPDSREVIGIHIISEYASVYSGIASLIVEMGLSIDEVSQLVFPHPTFSEGLWEAIEAVDKRSIHFKG